MKTKDLIELLEKNGWIFKRWGDEINPYAHRFLYIK